MFTGLSGDVRGLYKLVRDVRSPSGDVRGCQEMTGPVRRHLGPVMRRQGHEGLSGVSEAVRDVVQGDVLGPQEPAVRDVRGLSGDVRGLSGDVKSLLGDVLGLS